MMEEIPDTLTPGEPDSRDPQTEQPRTFVFSEFSETDRQAETSASPGQRLRIVIGRARLSRAELDALRAGSVLMLENDVEEPVEVLADDRLIARGELVLVDSTLGVHVRERLAKPTVTPLRRAS